METRFLETFLAVAQHGSLAEASRRLGITPAAVAQRIQALEAEIGVPLLARSGRRAKPTEAGLALIARSRRILSDIRQLKGLGSAEPFHGELRLGAISTALTGLLPPMLRQALATMQGIDLFLLPGTSVDLYQSLVDEKIDAAILVRPPFAIPKTLEWHPIRSEPLLLFAPSAHSVTPAKQLLREQPFIRYDRNNWGGRQVDRYLHKQGIRPREWLELDSLEAIAVMVEAGLGVSIMPDWTCGIFGKLDVARLPLDMPVPSREIGLLAPRNSAASRLLRTMLAAAMPAAPT